MVTKKKTTKRKAPRKNTVNMQPDYKPYGSGKEPTMGDLSKMAMEGAVLSGSIGLMSTMGGMMSAAMPKKP
jgi:hypothetical protein